MHHVPTMDEVLFYPIYTTTWKINCHPQKLPCLQKSCSTHQNCCLILTSKHFLKDSPSCLSISNTVVHIMVIYCPVFSSSLPLAPAPWISPLGTRLWSYWSYVSPHVCGLHSHSLGLPCGIYPFLNACKPSSFYLPRLEQPRPPVPLVLLVYQMRPNTAHILLLVP